MSQRLLIDEDSQGRLLVARLRDGGHDVQTVTEAGLLAASDAPVLAHARAEERIVLTRNARDFAQLHEALPDHPGILVVCQDAMQNAT